MSGDVQLGDPALDEPMTVRVHPADDPADPNARRVILTRFTDDETPWPWVQVTGALEDADGWLEHREVSAWPVQYRPADLAAAADRPAS